jgi:uncharacterized protein
MKPLSLYRILVGGLAILLVLAGCASTQPARFYTLSAIITPQGGLQKGSSEAGSLIVAIGPIEIPDYLNRAQIVTRSSQNELKVAEFDRWAGSIDKDISRVLIEDLSNLLSPENISVISWRASSALETPFLFQAIIHLDRFEVMPDEKVLIKAKWSIIDKEGKPVLPIRESSFTEPVEGQGYGAKVEAMSRALADFGQEIAKGIKTLPR